jgi:hypothetical protein
MNPLVVRLSAADEIGSTVQIAVAPSAERYRSEQVVSPHTRSVNVIFPVSTGSSVPGSVAEDEQSRGGS